MFIKKILNKKGYTIPFALGLLLFLFALGASMLVSSFVNVRNSSIDYKQNQAYVYTRSFIDIMENKIFINGLGDGITEFVKQTNKNDSINNRYKNEYKFIINSSEYSNKEKIENAFNNDLVDVEMEVNYITKLKGQPIIGESTNFKFNVADTIDVIYKIKTSNHNSSNIYEYQITGKYYCSAISKNIDNSYKIEWKLDKYLGEIYTTQIKK